MPLQNRVAPTGEFLAVAARGAMMGNRGVLHDAARRLGRARWRHRRWVCCVLAFRGRRRAVMAPRRYTELFFLDEATALAAGHRPCAECRRADYTRFLSLWRAAVGPAAGADAMDAALHPARTARERPVAAVAALPDGAMALIDGAAHLVAQGRMWPWAPEGYGAPRAAPPGLRAPVLTPAPTVAVLAAGYRPAIAPCAP